MIQYLKIGRLICCRKRSLGNEEMKNSEKKSQDIFETVEPIGKRVLIRKDEDKKQTKGGIQLPDNIEIPTITGRIVAISTEVANNPEIPLAKYDKVLFNPKGVSRSISKVIIAFTLSRSKISLRYSENPDQKTPLFHFLRFSNSIAS